MGMEFVVVSYPTSRNVRIDGEILGKTNDTHSVEQGHHIFDLGDPHDYKPDSVEMDIENTTSIKPLIINDFKPK
jgi:hypothetical protein